MEEGEMERLTQYEWKYSYNFILDKCFLDNYQQYLEKIKESSTEDSEEMFCLMSTLKRAMEFN